MRMHAFAATIAVGAVLLASCSPGDDDSRPGVVSEASYTGLEVRRPIGVALFASWKDSPDSERVEVGERDISPELLRATCRGDGNDLRVVVEGPGGSELSSSTGSSTIGVDFPGLAEPVELDVAAYDLSWGPTGMEIDLFRSDFGSSASGSFPEEFGKVSGTLNIRMTVTC